MVAVANTKRVLKKDPDYLFHVYGFQPKLPAEAIVKLPEIAGGKTPKQLPGAPGTSSGATQMGPAKIAVSRSNIRKVVQSHR